MNAMLKWPISILVLGLSAAVFLWSRGRKKMRFQSRLAALFFLFSVIPTVLFSFLFAQLLLQTADAFIISDLDHTLTLSLDALKSRLQHEGRCFLSSVKRREDFSPENLQAFGFAYGGEISRRGVFLQKTKAAPDLDPHSFLQTSPQEQDRLLQEGQLISRGGETYFETFVQVDSVIRFVGLRLPEPLVEAKDAVSRTLRQAAALLVMRERMLQQKTIWGLAALLLLSLGGLAILLAGQVSRDISTPILRLTEGMKRIGAGDLSYRVVAEAKDEIAFLVESFNRMTEELRISREQLQRAERAAAWRDAARQISHEIKNPLTPIEFSLYRLEEGLKTSPQTEELHQTLAALRKEIASIRRLAEAFSQFARMPHAVFKTCDLAEIVRSTVDLFRLNNNIEIELTVEENLPPLSLDEQQIRSVVTNLIKNAVEASPPGEQVVVNVFREKVRNVAVVQVIDHGCGMDEETRRRIFDPYFTTKAGGAGIGLFLAQRIVADHGGTLDVQSRKGEGSTFTVFLPYEKPAMRQ
ncbi:MAG: ATP-binding protein [candidate division KSB1 bacterium]|nr:ATP-binding protein [candidate division KSB1 bacterium]